MRITSITIDLQDVRSIERSEQKKAELENKGWNYLSTEVDERLQMAVIYYHTTGGRLGINVEQY